MSQIRSENGKVFVTFDGADLRHAMDVALERQLENAHRAHSHRFPGTRDALWQQIKGCVGEKAVATYFGFPWYGALGDYKAADAGPLQVRTTAVTAGELRLYTQDKNDEPFVLAIWNTDADLAEVALVGWVFKRDVMREAYWKAWEHGGGCWNIPQAELRPMTELATLVQKQKAARAQAWIERHP